MMVINETMGMSYITIVSQCDFETNSVYKAVMSAASFVGKFSSLNMISLQIWFLKLNSYVIRILKLIILYT